MPVTMPTALAAALWIHSPWQVPAQATSFTFAITRQTFPVLQAIPREKNLLYTMKDLPSFIEMSFTLGQMRQKFDFVSDAFIGVIY